MPAYNEASRIGQSLEKILQFLEHKSWAYEILIVNDGSRDRTLEVVDAYRERTDRLNVLDLGENRGKGFAVREGMLAATGRYALFTDTDLSTPIGEVDKLLEALEGGFDVAIGSRALPASDVRVHQKWYRETGGRLFNKVVQLLTLPGIRDTQCGFKCFTKEAARRVFSRQRLPGWSFDVEILFIAQRLGFSIKEVPVAWSNSFDSKVSFLKDGLGMVADLIKIRYMHRKIDPA
jgi:dolichyl-phosphate beta-glucosyltransferase